MKVSRFLILVVLGTSLLSLTATPVKAQSTPPQILTGVRLMNVQKGDLASNTYTLDFYLWFSWEPTQFTIKQVQDFEFLNGAPAMTPVYVDDASGFLEYRVKGDFVKTFDFSKYPFETQDLQVKIEHKNMNATALAYVADSDSSLDSGVNVVDWGPYRLLGELRGARL